MSAWALADEHILRPPVVIDYPHGGALPPQGSYVGVREGSVTVAALKRGERGEGTVVRVWETHGTPTHASLDLGVCGRAWAGGFRAHEVKTLYCPDDPTQTVAEIDIPELSLDAP